jgi:hypothetical protein
MKIIKIQKYNIKKNIQFVTKKRFHYIKEIIKEIEEKMMLFLN